MARGLTLKRTNTYNIFIFAKEAKSHTPKSLSSYFSSCPQYTDKKPACSIEVLVVLFVFHTQWRTELKNDALQALAKI